MDTAADPDLDSAQDVASLTIKDVADACGLAQPVIAQLVPRTWTAEGWMYTPEQREVAIAIAEEMRARQPSQDRGNVRLRKLLADPERARRVADIRNRMRADDGPDTSHF
ncbi:hypothetical protein ACXYX3_27645 (plasmid) [Mycobacterium sp. C3-094]